MLASIMLPEHIEELRRCLWRAIFGLLGGLVIGFFISQPALEFIAGPINQELRTFYGNRRRAIEPEVQPELGEALRRCGILQYGGGEIAGKQLRAYEYQHGCRQQRQYP